MNTNNKPTVELSGIDGNVFCIIGTVSKALKRAGMPDKAKEFSSRAMNAGSYDEVLAMCFEYCDVD